MTVRRSAVAAAMAGSMLVGGAAGVALLGPGSATAQTSSTTATTAPAASSTNPSGTFKSNEDPAHEATESAAREAAENNGTATYGPPQGSAQSGSQ